MDYKPPKDEIPGITSWLYEANRPREPHEYRDYWKWMQKAKFKAEQLGIKSLDPVDLIDHLVALDDEIQRMTHFLEKEEKGREELIKEIDTLRTDLVEVKNQHNFQIAQKKELETKFKNLDNKKVFLIGLLAKYANHASDCAWMEWLESGRIDKNVTEANTCSCGWYIAQQKY